MSQPRPHPLDPEAASVPFRIGIVGGMGPMAGVFLQQLIIEATPADRDQDHFEVVCFTNPHVPERMRSLAEDGGRRYAAAVRDSAQLLVGAGVTHLVIPCNTAHARLSEIQQGVRVPIVDMIDLALGALVETIGPGRRVGLLATIGTLKERVYQDKRPGAVSEWILPDSPDQEQVARVILGVKVGRAEAVGGDLLAVGRRLVERGAEVLMVGCTELSLCADALDGAGVPRVDALRVVAAHLVDLGRRTGAGG